MLLWDLTPIQHLTRFSANLTTCFPENMKRLIKLFQKAHLHAGNRDYFMESARVRNRTNTFHGVIFLFYRYWDWSKFNTNCLVAWKPLNCFKSRLAYLSERKCDLRKIYIYSNILISRFSLWQYLINYEW
jgi:hypothetical protein